jgi:hypothetical protein
MATESSAVVEVARLAQQRPLRLPSEGREQTVVVRLPSRPSRWWLWLLAAAAVAASAIWLARQQRATAVQPVAEPLVEAPVIAIPLAEPPPAEPAVAAGAKGEPADESESDPATEQASDTESTEPQRPRRRSQVVGFGILQIGSKPPCDIFIDGRRTGLETPQRNIKLRPGRHLIRLSNREVGIDERFPVRIRDGRTTKVIRDMTDRL